MQILALVVRTNCRAALGLLAWLFLSALALAQAQPAPSAEPRLALVIGNAAYRTSPLANPVNDARLMETALRNAGFQVLKAENANRRDMQRLIRDFGERLKQSGGVGLFYFAGHGMQVRGNNYLIPLDADIRSEDEVAFDSIDAQSVLEKMETARNRVNLLILDACRDNPFIRGSRSAAVGLATMNAPSGSLIAYSTAPGSVASDGKGQNGLYTEQLARMMQEPGLAVEDVFKQVRVAVRRASNNQQTPWENTALEGRFFFQSPAPPQAATQAARPLDSQAADMAFWDSIKADSKPAELQAYLARFPDGLFAGLARSRLAEVTPALTKVTAPSLAAAQAVPTVIAQSSPPAAVRTATPAGIKGVLILRDKLTRQEQRIDLVEIPAPGGVMRYSTGDVVAADGQVRSVRMGTLVATALEGELWKFPLEMGRAGSATIKLDGVSRPAKLDWRVAGKQDGRASVQARIEYVADGAISTSFRRQGTWTGSYQDGLPVAMSHDSELRSSATGSAPDLVSGELKLTGGAAAPAAPAAVQVPAATGPAPPPADAGPGLVRIYIYRRADSMFSSIQPDVRVNGQAAGIAPRSGEFFFIERPSGPYEVAFKQMVMEAKVSVRLEADKPVFIRVAQKWAPIVGSHFAPEIVDSATATKDLASLGAALAPAAPSVTAPRAEVAAAAPESLEAIKLDANDVGQDAVEAKSESGAPLTYRMVAVVPPFFHGYAADTLSGVASAAPAKIANFVKQEKIDMGAIIRIEFDRQLRALPAYANWAKTASPLKIQIRYRYGIGSFMLSGYKPWLALGVAVIDASGKVVWSGTDGINAISGSGSTPSMEYAAYFNSPQVFKSTFEGAARLAVQSMMKQIKLPAP